MYKKIWTKWKEWTNEWSNDFWARCTCTHHHSKFQNSDHQDNFINQQLLIFLKYILLLKPSSRYYKHTDIVAYNFSLLLLYYTVHISRILRYCVCVLCMLKSWWSWWFSIASKNIKCSIWMLMLTVEWIDGYYAMKRNTCIIISTTHNAPMEWIFALTTAFVQFSHSDS